MLKHVCNTGPIIIVIGSLSGSPALNLFKLEYFSFDMRIPDVGHVLQLLANKHVIGSFSDLNVWGFNVSFECAISFDSNSVNVGVPR